MGGADLSVVRAYERADDRNEHGYLDADQPREVAIYFLIDGVEPLVHLPLQLGEAPVDLFEPTVHLILQLHEPMVHLFEPPVHLIQEAGQCAAQVGRIHGVSVHLGLKGGDPLFQCRHVDFLAFRVVTTR
ncbi:MAG: hypothetical protein ABW292_06860 [Vicinamibacterales bacterium]